MTIEKLDQLKNEYDLLTKEQAKLQGKRTVIQNQIDIILTKRKEILNNIGIELKNALLDRDKIL